jgi:hypothetical protein
MRKHQSILDQLLSKYLLIRFLNKTSLIMTPSVSLKKSHIGILVIWNINSMSSLFREMPILIRWLIRAVNLLIGMTRRFYCIIIIFLSSTLGHTWFTWSCVFMYLLDTSVDLSINKILSIATIWSLNSIEFEDYV